MCSLLTFAQEILLVIIEVRWHVARIVLRRRIGITAEMLAVPFAAFDEMHVRKIGGDGLDSIEHVAQHHDIVFDAFDAAFAMLCPRAIEDVANVAAVSQRIAATNCVVEISRDPVDTIAGFRWCAT